MYASVSWSADPQNCETRRCPAETVHKQACKYQTKLILSMSRWSSVLSSRSSFDERVTNCAVNSERSALGLALWRPTPVKRCIFHEHIFRRESSLLSLHCSFPLACAVQGAHISCYYHSRPDPPWPAPCLDGWRNNDLRPLAHVPVMQRHQTQQERPQRKFLGRPRPGGPLGHPSEPASVPPGEAPPFM